MNLDCLETIITNNLAIHIDISNINSWNLNSGLTLISLTKWKNAISDDIILYDFGLTAFDNGRVENMYDSLTLTQNDNKLNLHRVGYNDDVGGIYYSGYTMTSITGTTVGNYFSLNGGYLQDFFKLYDYNYEIFPSRYNNGITIETIVELLPQSEGIFLCLGIRSEDKYNKYFSGETTLINSERIDYNGKSSGNLNYYDGVFTSENNYLISDMDKEVKKNAFREPEKSDVLISDSIQQLNNLTNNIISFEITSDKRIKYKYINEYGNLIQNESPNTINRIGWTMIDIVFKPDEIINNYDASKYLCYSRRTGDLLFYLNGRIFWKIPNFNEFYFKHIINDKEKQLGIPFNISWGGGSFGLENSWHYDINKLELYSSGDTNYITQNFIVEGNPDPLNCQPDYIGEPLSGLSLVNDNITFTTTDECDPTITYPLTTMRIDYSGVTTGITANTFFIKYNTPIQVLSNREYDITLNLFDSGFFTYSEDSKISIILYGTTNINIINEIAYTYPKYVDVHTVSGLNTWQNLNTKFTIEDNTGIQTIFIGILIESTTIPNLNIPLYIDDFSLIGSDALSKDVEKENLFIEKYFNSSFIGNIQKLRMYDIALLPNEILHNAIIESKNNINYGISVAKGGRIIPRYQNVPNIPQEVAGSDIRKSIRYRNSDGTYKDLYQMLDIKVVIKSRSNPTVELVKFKKIVETGWLQLIWVNDTTYDFIIPNQITSAHPNEMLFAEVKFQWSDPQDIDNVFDKIFIVNITTSTLLDSTVKIY